MADAVAASAILAKPGATTQYKKLRQTPFANRNSRTNASRASVL